MNSIANFYNGFICATRSDRRKMIYIAALTVRVFVITKFYPLSSYIYKYFNLGTKQMDNLQPYKEDICLIRKVLKNLPFRRSCLSESIIVHLYLKKKGINAHVILGVNVESHLKAHAWNNFQESNSYHQLIFQNGQEIRKKTIVD